MLLISRLLRYKPSCIEAIFRGMSSLKLLERYKAGDCEAVWQRLKNLGEIKQQFVRDEALEVAREMMRRVRYNFNIIVNNLIKVGFEFYEPEKVVVPAKPDACEYLDDFEQQWGILPLSVRAWFEVIHSIKFSPSKLLSKNSLQFLDSESVILKYCFHCDYDINIFDAVSDDDELRWYPREINFYSLSKSVLKNQGMSLRVERSETKQSQGFEVSLHFVT